MSLSIQLGNFLYKNAFPLYRPLYGIFKKKQDAFEISLLKKHVKKNEVVLDIGANIGFYAGILADLVGPGGQVHCFEPDEKNFSYLHKSVHGKKNIIINNCAIGPRSEKIKIYTSKELNVDHRTYKPDEFEREIEITAISVDDYLARKGKNGESQKVDFIKMDIQGFETEAVKGMHRTLEANPEVKIISEFWPYGLKKAGGSAREYAEQLKNLGFRSFILRKHSLEELGDVQLEEIENLGEEHYFNIFASR